MNQKLNNEDYFLHSNGFFSVSSFNPEINPKLQVKFGKNRYLPREKNRVSI